MKILILKIINPLLVVLVINQFLTGYFPSLYGPGTFSRMHMRAADLLAIVVFVHFLLNMSWFKSVYFKLRSKGEKNPDANRTKKGVS